MFHFELCLKNIYLLEPRHFRAEKETTHGFRISFDAPDGNKEIDHFTVELKGPNHPDKCHIPVNDKKRSCDFDKLPPNTEYSVLVQCCLKGWGGCSRPLVGKAKTLRMLLFRTYQRHILPFFITSYSILASSG